MFHSNSNSNKSRGLSVNDLKTDLRDGVILINFFEILSGKKVRSKYSLNPTLRILKIQNLGVAFAHLNEEILPRHSYAPEDIVDSDKNIKMLLGLLWTLYIKYRIAIIKYSGQTSEEGLLLWCKEQTKGYRHVDIKDFKNSFNDGMAFLALIHHLDPKTTAVKYETFGPQDRVKNLTAAFDFAEKELNIPKILDPKEVAEGKADERALILYNSLFFHAYRTIQQARETAERTRLAEENLLEEKKKMQHLQTDNDELKSIISDLQTKLAFESQKSSLPPATALKLNKRVQDGFINSLGEGSVQVAAGAPIKDLDEEIENATKLFQNNNNNTSKYTNTAPLTKTPSQVSLSTQMSSYTNSNPQTPPQARNNVKLESNASSSPRSAVASSPLSNSSSQNLPPSNNCHTQPQPQVQAQPQTQARSSQQTPVYQTTTPPPTYQSTAPVYQQTTQPLQTQAPVYQTQAGNVAPQNLPAPTYSVSQVQPAQNYSAPPTYQNTAPPTYQTQPVYQNPGPVYQTQAPQPQAQLQPPPTYQNTAPVYQQTTQPLQPVQNYSAPPTYQNMAPPTYQTQPMYQNTPPNYQQPVQNRSVGAPNNCQPYPRQGQPQPQLYNTVGYPNQGQPMYSNQGGYPFGQTQMYGVQGAPVSYQQGPAYAQIPQAQGLFLPAQFTMQQAFIYPSAQVQYAPFILPVDLPPHLIAKMIQASETFRLFDGFTGQINYFQWLNALASLGFIFTEEQASAMFYMIDQNRSGTINEREFCEWFISVFPW